MCTLHEKSSNPSPGVIWFHAIDGPGNARIIVYADKFGVFMKATELKRLCGYKSVATMCAYTKPNIFTKKLGEFYYRCIAKTDIERILNHTSSRKRQGISAWLTHVVLPAVLRRVKTDSVRKKLETPQGHGQGQEQEQEQATQRRKLHQHIPQAPREPREPSGQPHQHRMRPGSLDRIRQDIAQARAIAIELGCSKEALPTRIQAIIKSVYGYDCAALMGVGGRPSMEQRHSGVSGHNQPRQMEIVQGELVHD